MSAFATQRIAGLARALGVSPRQALLAAARLARDGTTGDAQRRCEIVRDARAQLTAMQGTAALLLATPIASFAQDDVERALASLWPARFATDA
ncbi:hypothetical protein [Dokdonella soli]|uniref:Uncharacterized protein n=1 Tax=Dokdonella soli TaxID=529810 RepID=A0ABN1IGN6_9GAMM